MRFATPKRCCAVIHGRFVTGKECAVTLASKEATDQQVLPAGIDFTVTLPAQPGSCRLRAVVGEGVEGKVRAWTLPVEIH